MISVIESFQVVIPDKSVRREAYKAVYKALRERDWDTVNEALKIDPVFDGIVKEVEPEWFDDDDDE